MGAAPGMVREGNVESFPSHVCCFPSLGAELFVSHSPESRASGPQGEDMNQTAEGAWSREQQSCLLSLATGRFQSCVLVYPSFAVLASDAVSWLWLLPRAEQKHFDLVSGVFPGVQLSGTC